MLQRFFLESPWMLVPTLVVVQLILIKVWSNRRTQRTRSVMNLGFLMCLILPVMQWMITTRREQVQQACYQLVNAVEAGDIDAIADQVSDTFRADDIDRDTFVESVERALTRVTVENPILRGLHVEFTDDDTAEAQFGVMCRLITSNDLIHNHISAWTLRFVRVDDAWLLESVTPRPGPMFPYTSLAQIVRSTH